MEQSPATPPKPDRADVFLDQDNIINIVAHGHITLDIVNQAVADIRRLATDLRGRHLPVYLLIDLGDVKGHDSDARIAIDQAGIALDYNRSAAFGGSMGIALVMQYLQQHLGDRGHYFHFRPDAIYWLRRGEASTISRLRALPITMIGLITAALITVIASVTLSWQSTQHQAGRESQAALEKQADTQVAGLQQRFELYQQSLAGVRALFPATHSVSRTELHNFVLSLDLAKQYPGFTSVSYVKRLTNSQKGDYLIATRADTSLNAHGYPQLRIYPGSYKDEYFVKTYTEPADDATLGFDLSTSPESLTALLQARDSDELAASTSVQLDGTDQGRGFIMALPIYDSTTSPTTVADRRAQLTGFVTASFEYDKVFPSVFTRTNTTTVTASVLDADDHPLFSNAPANASQQTVRRLSFGGQQFKLVFTAPAGYGLTAASQSLSVVILASGAIVVVLIVVVMVVLLRSRRDAIKLAGAMTEDLEKERDIVAADQTKLVQTEADLKAEKTGVEQKIAERTQELTEAQAQLMASMSGLPFGFAIIDRADRILFANAELARLTNHPIPADPAAAGAVLQQIATDFTGAIDLLGLLHGVQQSRQPSEQVVAHGPRFFRFLATPVVLPGQNAPATDGSGQVIGAVWLLEDVTEQQTLQRSREEFLSIASHELRTPLTAIRGNISLILDIYGNQLKEPGLRQMVTDAHDASTRLINIVNDFIDMSRLEQGDAAFNIEAVNLGNICESVLREYQGLAKSQKLTLKYDAPPAPAVAMADSGRVHQVLGHLLSNSLRYTESGGIILSLSIADKSVKLSVADTGRGIPVEYQHLLFHKFQQASPDILTRDASRSTGLGLYISRLIIEGMHGQLYLEHSEVRKGTVFTIELPTA
ncbi:MAG TPA: CHASE domain-containing protein [Candidatus Saccharimonas sp.]|nr:CHASE domain-containing protein [Candidatus Saccharimonas sp.]